MNRIQLIFLCFLQFFFFSGSATFSQSEAQSSSYIPTIDISQPTYPPLAKTARAQGKVVVELTVNPDGKVSQTRIKEGHPLLARPVQKVLENWVFVAESESSVQRKVEVFYTFELLSPSSEGEETIVEEAPNHYKIQSAPIQLSCPTVTVTRVREMKPIKLRYWENRKLKTKH